MIEIKDGWRVQEMHDQHHINMLSEEIKSLNKQLEIALEAKAKIQSKCNHNHVIISGQLMTCEVCGASL